MAPRLAATRPQLRPSPKPHHHGRCRSSSPATHPLGHLLAHSWPPASRQDPLTSLATLTHLAGHLPHTSSSTTFAGRLPSTTSLSSHARTYSLSFPHLLLCQSQPSSCSYDPHCAFHPRVQRQPSNKTHLPPPEPTTVHHSPTHCTCKFVSSRAN